MFSLVNSAKYADKFPRGLSRVSFMSNLRIYFRAIRVVTLVLLVVLVFPVFAQDDNQSISEVTTQYNIGLMYAGGFGVNQDYKEAMRWYQMAAEKGYAPAQIELGVMYAEGWGVSSNYVSAYMWFDLAAAQSTNEKQSKAIELRHRISEKMTSEQIVKAKKMFHEWQAKNLLN